MKKNKKDIAVFTFTKGSQENLCLERSESFIFVENIINSMLIKNNLNVPKVGLGGYKKDLILFIVGLIEIRKLLNLDIQYYKGKTRDFDPDQIS